MRLSHTPPAGAGKVRHITQTDKLLAIIDGLGTDKNGNPIGIRSPELAAASGIAAKSITSLLSYAVTKGRVFVCKVTIPGAATQNEYRKGGGVPAPGFVPLNTKRADIARSAPASAITKQPQPAVGTSTPAAGGPVTPPAEPAVAAAPATPAPDARAVLKEEPAAQKAPAGNDFGITLDDTGVLTITTCEGVIELQPNHAKRLGHFMVGSERIWNPF